MKNFHTLLKIVLTVIAIWWALSLLKAIPDFKTIFKEKEVQIDKTAVLIKEIKALAQLVTISAYDEIIVDSTVAASVKSTGLAALYPALLPSISIRDQKIVLIGKTTTQVGLNLQTLNPSDVLIIKDSLHITLPAAQILDVILNPSDLEIFDEKGDWNNTAMINLKNKIRYIAAQNAASIGLLAQSEKKAKDILGSFYKAAGYQKIGFSFKD